MKAILILSTVLFSLIIQAEVTPIEAKYICVNQFQKGYAFHPDTKRAWQVNQLTNRSGLEVSIYPDEFEVYRCPGCFSFKGFVESQSEIRQVYAFTHLNTLHHEMWMFYLTQTPSGEMVQETIPCREM